MGGGPATGVLARMRGWARRIKRDVTAVWLAGRDPRTPMVAKVLAILVAAYALSPVDLIPDFIPVLGYLDDLVIVPLGILLVVRNVPADLMDEFRERAMAMTRPVNRVTAMVFVAVWVACGFALAWWWQSSRG